MGAAADETRESITGWYRRAWAHADPTFDARRSGRDSKRSRRCPYNADTLERSSRVHDVASLGVSPRREPVLWSHVLDVRSRDCPFVAALLTFVALDRNLVMDMSTTQSCRNH